MRDDGVLSGLLGLRLPVGDAADLDVEEMNLAVRRDDVAVGVEDERRVRELLASVAALGDRAADERDAVAARPSRHRSDRLATVERLGRGVELLGRPDRIPLLGQNNDIGAGRSSLRDEPLRRFEVGGLVGATRHLHARDSNPLRHG